MDFSVQPVYGKIKNGTQCVSVPGSKSITARALLLAALAQGESTLYNAQISDDCATFISCLQSLGINCLVSGTTVKVNGCGGVLPVQKASINVGSAGTAARFLLALLALSQGEFYIDSSAAFKSRPMAPLFNTLRATGAEIISQNNTFPVTIRRQTPQDFAEVEVDVTQSSQFLSAMLMSAVCAKGGLNIRRVGSHGLDYVGMTLDMMWSFGVNVTQNDNLYCVKGSYSAKKYDIEPDLSAACYFYAANRILGTDIRVNGILPHSMQGDLKFIKLIKDFNGGTVDMSAFSDQALTLAAVAPFFKNPTRIVNIAHIRGQECNRISAILHNLTQMGVPCEELPDGVLIRPAQPRPAQINTFGDHRVAMSFALTGLRAGGITIKNAEVCSKTFPDYFKVLSGLCKSLTGE